ncbi:MAG: hypothetical protein JNM29_19465 [Candidatus Odyssella sp.]|nr:hypothetical protein [Candidatus Odyssella sp.]
MRPREAAELRQSSCIKAIEEFRARLHMLEQDLKNTRDELLDLYKNMPQAGTPEYEERQDKIAQLSRWLAALDVAHAQALPTLERMEASAARKERKAKARRPSSSSRCARRSTIRATGATATPRSPSS